MTAVIGFNLVWGPKMLKRLGPQPIATPPTCINTMIAAEWSLDFPYRYLNHNLFAMSWEVSN